MVYLPTFTTKIQPCHVGKYTLCPMDAIRWIPLIPPFTWVHLIMHLLQLFRISPLPGVTRFTIFLPVDEVEVVGFLNVPVKGRRDSWGTLRIPFGKIGEH